MSGINTGVFSVIEDFKNMFKNMIEHSSIHKYAHIIGSNNAIGDHINNSNNIKNSFGIDNSENIKYGIRVLNGTKDCMDVYGLTGASLIYDSFTVSVQTNASCFSFLCMGSVSEVQYSAFCNGSNNLFGCVGVKKGSYSILNKKYTKEEYNELLPKIIQHMNDVPYVDVQCCVYRYGDFFPLDFSPFGVNETIAYDLFNLTKADAENLGCKWKSPDDKIYKITVEARDLKDNVEGTDSTITEEVIGCLHGQTCTDQCTKGFKVLAKDLEFYKKNNLPLPRLCPNCRHYERLKYRNPTKLWHRTCMKEGCNNEFETSYAPDRPEIVYCEKCYQNEVY